MMQQIIISVYFTDSWMLIDGQCSFNPVTRIMQAKALVDIFNNNNI